MTMKKKKTNHHNTPAPQAKTLLHEKLSFAATEAYKLLRANLMFTIPDEQKCRIVGVTSSIRGEGKSTTAINLSYTLAETGKRVLLIDCDLRLPSVAKKLGIEASPGISNLLIGTATEEDAVLKFTDMDTWFILPSGDIPPNPAEMLGSTQMAAQIKKFSEQYDYIVVDLPPVNIVSDALVISPLVDGMIVVIRENYSERRALNTCTNQLVLSNVKILGFVMNGATDGNGSYSRYKRYKYYKSSKYYSHKYYKQYGYYYQGAYEKSKHRRKKKEEPKTENSEHD